MSSTLRWKNASTNNGGWDGFLSIQGQSQSGTIIKLQDNLPAFANPAAPAAVLMTGSRDGEGKYSDLNGEGNQAFENSILNLTVDVGSGNPGAIGVDYQVSNWGPCATSPCAPATRARPVCAA